MCWRRYILAFAVADYSNQAWFQSFNDSAELIMGVTADDLYERRVCRFLLLCICRC
jgi:hypothetical protein